jgi:hypothetical protein
MKPRKPRSSISWSVRCSVEPMQLAALLLEKKAEELSEGEAESLVHPKRHASR